MVDSEKITEPVIHIYEKQSLDSVNETLSKSDESYHEYREIRVLSDEENNDEDLIGNAMHR